MKWPWGIEHRQGAPVPAEVQLTIWNDHPGLPEAGGSDSCIIMIPPECYRQGRLLLPATARALGEASGSAARRLGETLHHAEWTITGQPDTVRTLASRDCPACLASADQAVAYLAEHPAELVAVAQLWWTH